MKNLLVVCFLVASIIGCKKEETATQTLNTPEAETHPIHGKWNLKQYIQGWAPMYQYSDGEILFEFRTNNILSVEITEGTEVSPYMPLNQSGEYSFSIQDTNLIVIDSMAYSFYPQEGVVILDNGMAVDGFGFFLTPAE